MDLILGIDFGTTNTVISFFKNNKSNILKDGIYKSIPSKIGIKDDIIYCGNYLPLKSDYIYNNFKVKIGTNTNQLIYENINLSENEILFYFFNHLMKIIIKNFGNNINIKSVITVPSNFNDIQREIIKNNFNKTNFNVIRIINEPTAAALAYGLTNINENEEKILVIDLGGGTLDLSILLKENGFFEIIHSIGINDLGGNNFTDVIYNYILKKYPNINNKNKSTLWYNCQNAKEKLSFVSDYDIKMKNYNENNDLLFNLDIKQFEKLSHDIINRFDEILNKIKNEFEDIKYVIMVGNSSKLPMVLNKIEEVFNFKPWIHPNLESVVAEGACMYGAITENIYQSNFNVLLVDVVPLSLGIETSDGSFSIIIPKNTPLPVKRSQQYTLDTPFETFVKVKVFQGERKIAEKNTLIGEFEFDKITSSCKPIINISFKVDLNGIINVTIIDKKSNVEKNILIKDIPEISDEEKENIIKLAEENNVVDEEENLIKTRLYLINSKIDIILSNIKLNNLIVESKKNELVKEILELENKSINGCSTILLDIIKELNEKFCTFTNVQDFTEDNIFNNNDTDLEKIILQEQKQELLEKVTLLLNKNPEWDEYLKPILDELNFSNVTIEYIQDKLEIIKELDEDTEYVNSDYKEQLKNLCLFLKSEIEVGSLNLDEEKIVKLIDLIDNNLVLLNNYQFTNEIEINWQEILIDFNSKCEELK